MQQVAVELYSMLSTSVVHVTFSSAPVSASNAKRGLQYLCTLCGASVQQASSSLLPQPTHLPGKFAAQQLRHFGFYSSFLAQLLATQITL
jgi:hypothetical protein